MTSTWAGGGRGSDVGPPAQEAPVCPAGATLCPRGTPTASHQTQDAPCRASPPLPQPTARPTFLSTYYVPRTVSQLEAKHLAVGQVTFPRLCPPHLQEGAATVPPTGCVNHRVLTAKAHFLLCPAHPWAGVTRIPGSQRPGCSGPGGLTAPAPAPPPATRSRKRSDSFGNGAGPWHLLHTTLHLFCFL